VPGREGTRLSSICSKMEGSRISEVKTMRTMKSLVLSKSVSRSLSSIRRSSSGRI